jgi:hypothetical protein
LDASPDAVFVASAGGSATSGGGGIVGIAGVVGAGVAAAALGTGGAASTVSIPLSPDPPLSHPKATVQPASAKTKRFRCMRPRSSTRSGACAISNPSQETSLPVAAQGAGLGAFDHSSAALALDTKGVKA